MTNASFLSHTRLWEQVIEEEKQAVMKEKKADAEVTKKAVKTLQSKVEKSTLGDLGVLADLKAKMDSAAADQAAADQPAAEKPAAAEATVAQPAVEKPAAVEAAAAQPAAEKPAADEAKAEQPAVEKPAAEEAADDTTEEPTA